MSHDYANKVLHFNCDHPGCHRNYEASTGSFKDAWAEAREDGWVNSCEYVRGISTWLHYCPDCKGNYGD